MTALHEEIGKSHWSYTDNFGTDAYEYIKSFVHTDYAIGYHTHSFYELNVGLAGRGVHYIEQTSCEASVGSVFLIPPYVRHGYVNEGGLDVYHMLIHRDFIGECFSEFRRSVGYSMLFEIEPYLRARYHENLFLVLDGKALAWLCDECAAIEDCQGVPGANIFINAIAKRILSQLCLLIERQHGVTRERALQKGALDIAWILNYIHRNFDEKLTVEHLARQLNLSRSTFIRQFTKVCGCPPHQYIQNYRVKKASEYLSDAEKTSSRIAQECGFYDASHMRKQVYATRSGKNADREKV
jgi:AraC-like DNA-binding protein/quercetin dioxygenase-like cupin family protein